MNEKDILNEIFNTYIYSFALALPISRRLTMDIDHTCRYLCFKSSYFFLHDHLYNIYSQSVHVDTQTHRHANRQTDKQLDK